MMTLNYKKNLKPRAWFGDLCRDKPLGLDVVSFAEMSLSRLPNDAVCIYNLTIRSKSKSQQNEYEMNSEMT